MSLPFVTKYHLNLLHLALNIFPLTGMILVWNMIYLSYHLMKQYHSSEIEKWKLEAEVQKANLGNLRSQINPHFMFNALNNIRALITEDPQRARYMLTVFAENFRYALRHAENKEVGVEEEMAILEKYLELLKIQYEEKLQYTIHADDIALKETIPPMILQLLVENGIKHGIALSATGGLVAIDITKSNGVLQLTVKNTGTLQHQQQLEDSLGIGLKNIRQRLALLYNGRASLTIEEQSPFVIVTINIDRS